MILSNKDSYKAKYNNNMIIISVIIIIINTIFTVEVSVVYKHSAQAILYRTNNKMKKKM